MRMSSNRSPATIAIVGGGVIGLSIAWRLAVSGREVIVIDAQADKPPATLAAAGMLTPSFEAIPCLVDSDFKLTGIEKTLFEFGQSSLALWPNFAECLQATSGLDIDFRLNGVLGVATSAQMESDAQRQTATLQKAGVECTFLDAGAMREQALGFGQDVIGGILTKKEGQVDPLLVHRALSQIVRRAAEIIPQPVEQMRGGENGLVLDLAASEKEPATTLEVGAVVIAAGAYATSILATLGVSLGDALRPVKGEALALSTATLDGAGIPETVIRARDLYLCPKKDGRLIIGATEVEGRTDHRPEDDAIEALRKRAVSLLPALGDCVEISRWAGLRPGSRDRAPLIGRAQGAPDGVFVALGAYRNGILFAPAIADLVEVLVNNREQTDATKVALSAFNPSRFG